MGISFSDLFHFVYFDNFFIILKYFFKKKKTCGYLSSQSIGSYFAQVD